MLKSIVLSVFGFATVTAAGAEGLRLQALNETPLLMAGSERVTYLDVSGREGWSVGGCGNVHQAELRDGSVATAFRLTRDKRIVWRLGGPDRNRMCVTRREERYQRRLEAERNVYKAIPEGREVFDKEKVEGKMNSFTYCNSVKVVFGNGVLAKAFGAADMLAEILRRAQ